MPNEDLRARARVCSTVLPDFGPEYLQVIDAMALPELADEGRRHVRNGKVTALSIVAVVECARRAIPDYQEWLRWCEAELPYGKAHLDKCVRIGRMLRRELASRSLLSRCEFNKLDEFTHLKPHLLGPFLDRHPDAAELPREQVRDLVRAWRRAAAAGETEPPPLPPRDTRTPREKLADFDPEKLNPIEEFKFLLTYCQRAQDSLIATLRRADPTPEFEAQFKSWTALVKAGMDELSGAFDAHRRVLADAKKRGCA